MEGFGNTGLAGPFDYGSVKDGYSHNPTIEQRLKKKFWKTKQTVRQKLNKREDEFVVAGDAAIDAKLELARHLGDSCSRLTAATSRCIYHIKYLSAYEDALGNYLSSCGELDFTLAGQIMTKTGEAHKKHAEIRLLQVPGFLRLQSETTTFTNSGLGDLNFSIDNLEKARKDYRAALLWMKDVSEKLHNPDARGQLVRFREVQAHVKLTKERFEHLKELLSEKIVMVSASRCNLLSNILPMYQSAMLEYFDKSANDLHTLLDDLRSQTQHQYKVKDLSMEIRDLEVYEETSTATTEMGEIETGDTPTDQQATPTGNEDTPTDSSKDKPPSKKSLFGLLQGEIITEKSTAPPRTNPDPASQKSHDKNQSSVTPTPDIEENKSEDLPNGNDQATPLKSNDNDQATPLQSNPPTDHLDDLLSLLDDTPMVESSLLEPEPNKVGGDKGGDEWDTFMDRQDESGWGELVRHAHNEGEDNGWSQNVVEGDKNISELEEEIDKMLSLEEDNKSTSIVDGSLTEDDGSFDPLHETAPSPNGNTTPTPTNEDEGDHLQLDPSLFQQPPPSNNTLPGSMPPPLMPLNSSPLPVLPSNATPTQSLNSPFTGLPAFSGSGMSMYTVGQPGLAQVGTMPGMPGLAQAGTMPGMPGLAQATNTMQGMPGLAHTNTMPGMPGLAQATNTMPGMPGLAHTNTMPGMPGLAQATGSIPTQKQVSATSKEDNKKKNWSNVFAHLDPIAIEKA